MQVTDPEPITEQKKPVIAPDSLVKRRKSTKPQAVKTAVIARMVEGQSKTQIAKDLGITRNTVRSIAAESEIDQHLIAGTALSASLIPKAVNAVSKALDREKPDGLLGLSFLKWQLGENPNSKSGESKALNAVFSNCQVLIQQAQLHKNAAEPSTNPSPENSQPIDSAEVKP